MQQMDRQVDCLQSRRPYAITVLDVLHRRPRLLKTTMDLAGHLYESFLHAQTSDISLRAAGNWSATYRLHRVVLIQSGFFRSLFTSGFEESSSEKKDIEIVFDDRNITRAAFEICIARLYGGGPPLHISADLTPTPAKPLTPAFPFGPSLKNPVPEKHQPASPKFLLSLLAAALYLEIPSIASHALSSILATIGPYTVIEYLNFARGKPILIDAPDAPAVGLEHVAEVAAHSYEHDTASISDTASSIHIGTSGPSLRFYYGAISDKVGEACACWLARWGPDLFEYEERLACAIQPTSRARTDTDPISTRPEIPIIPPVFTSFEPGQGLSPRWIRALISSDSLFVPDELARYAFAKRVVELRRKLRRGSSESFVLLPGDKGKGKETQQQQQEYVLLPEEEAEEREWSALFESGIYYANLSPADLIIISTDISPTINAPYVPLRVIQAANWDHTTLRHIISVSPQSPSGSIKEKKDLGITISGADIYARQEHLAQQDSVRPYFLIPHDESLRVGDTINTSGGALSEGNIHNNISMDELFAKSFASYSPSTSSKSFSKSSADSNPATTSNERSFFGLLPDTLDTLLRLSSPPTNNRSILPLATPLLKVPDALTSRRNYSTYPPFRFSVEFWDLDSLKDKQRLHSQTVWYAGSLFNVYVQVVKKKEKEPIVGSTFTERQREREREREREKEAAANGTGLQLGIYLHRQSTVESLPPRSAPSPMVVPVPREFKGRERANTGGIEMVNLKEGESVLMGTASLSASTNSSSTNATSNRRDTPSSPGTSWLRTHVRGPSLPQVSASNVNGTGSAPQSPTIRSGTPLSLTLTRSRTPINANLVGRPTTSSSMSPTISASPSVGFLSSSLPEPSSVVAGAAALSASPSSPTLSPNLNVLSAGTPSLATRASTTQLRILTPGNTNGTSSPILSTTEYASSSPPYMIPSSAPAQQPYRDPRAIVSVYFSVFCASPTGSGQTRFRSGPDVFKIGQSWGWKSGGLVVPGSAAARSGMSAKQEGSWTLSGKEVSLRATVILGVV
ncbi:hypothetical protein VNI00_011863 [Paramarasmius palmivorus]|uniref:BTB domain-containing protein n=1 Tax=Paramarasmius palmivorus TaxID=297713 RepID=A0AAW0C8D4_9AGAR